mgnify:CR=1 FL=1
MVNSPSISDIDTIKKLGLLLNDNFIKTNNIEEIINNKEIIGYYILDKLVGFIIFKKLYETIDILYVVVEPDYRRKGISSKLLNEIIKMDCKHIMLEVNTKNITAINLYKKNRELFYGSKFQKIKNFAGFRSFSFCNNCITSARKKGCG